MHIGIDIEDDPLEVSIQVDHPLPEMAMNHASMIMFLMRQHFSPDKEEVTDDQP